MSISVVVVDLTAELLVLLLDFVALTASVLGFLALGTMVLGLRAFASHPGQHHRDPEHQDRAADCSDNEELGGVVDAGLAVSTVRPLVWMAEISGLR